MTNPSRGVRPMVVSTLLPPRTAQALQPLPRWTLTNEHTPRSLRYESMARAVKAIATNAVFGVQVIRNRVEVGPRRQRLVKGGIKDRYLRQPREEPLRGSDSHYVGGIVQRCQMIAIFD